jgi:hypothetical protein
MRKSKEVKIKSVSYVHDPNATQKWMDIYMDIMMDAKRREMKK